MNSKPNTRPPPAAATQIAYSSEAAEQQKRPADLQAKQVSWHRQDRALGAEHYRITLAPRREGLLTRNYRNEGHRKRGVPERFWSPQEVTNFIPELTQLNRRGYDIYITPIDDRHHYLVVDDVSADMLVAMRNEEFQPCLVQLSSENNHQVVLKARKLLIHQEQQIANKLVVSLNTRFGDVKFCGVVHPFRFCGFANRKPGRNNVFAKVVEARGNTCRLVARLLDEMVSASGALSAKPVLERAVRQDIQASANGATGQSLSNTAAATAFVGARRKVLAWVNHRRLIADESKIDFRAAVSLLQDGWEQHEVELAIHASPDLLIRHADPSAYAARTAIAAAVWVASQR